MSDASPRERLRVTRRGFPIGTGTAGAGLALSVVLGRESIYRFVAGQLAHAMSEGFGAPVTDRDVCFELTPHNFDRYPLITNRRTPDIEVRILGIDGKPRGMGEPMIGTVAMAVGNAFFNVTGKRLRRIPSTPERMRAALAWTSSV